MNNLIIYAEYGFGSRKEWMCWEVDAAYDVLSFCLWWNYPKEVRLSAVMTADGEHIEWPFTEYV